MSGIPDLEWVTNSECGRVDLPLDAFFVEAGHVIDEEVLEVCRRCPVRRECVDHVYTRGLPGGYFAGLSPGLRKRLSFEEAVAYIENDPPRSSKSEKTTGG